MEPLFSATKGRKRGWTLQKWYYTLLAPVYSNVNKPIIQAQTENHLLIGSFFLILNALKFKGK